MSNALLDGLDDVKVYEELPFLDIGANYELEVENLTVGKSRDTGNDYFRAVVKVLSAEGAKTNALGTKASIIFSQHRKYPEYAQKDMKRFCAAVSGTSPTEITGENIRYLIGSDQPAAGTVFKATVTQAVNSDGEPKTRADGSPIAEYKFSSVK